MIIPKELQERIKQQLDGNRKITFLVGAGLSADSGIPTFRGKDGYWSDGSKNYTPQEMGTKRFFEVNANEVWRWYLFRKSICDNALPNQGHNLLVKFEHLLQNRFSLISQNVDGLHFAAGNSTKRLFLIHGDLRFMRCSEECSNELFPIPLDLLQVPRTRKTPLTHSESEKLKCPNCGEDSRPHVLWFDEYYNEKFYKLDSSMRIAKESGMLFVVGTSGATTLPQRIVENTLSRNGIVVDINPNEDYFTRHLESKNNGYVLKAGSSSTLQDLYDFMKSNLT